MGAEPKIETFHWSETIERCQDLGAKHDFVLDARGRTFEAPGLRISPPLVFPIRHPKTASGGSEETAADFAARRSNSTVTLEHYLATLPPEPGPHAVILMQAGAASLGYFIGGEAVATKSIKRYVVRGKGRAQPAYLKSKGKSRYGSRLRLQNARLLIEEINEKLTDYWTEFGEPELLFVGAPVRLWPDLFRGKTQPPFEQSAPIVRVPLDLPVPTTDVLLRTYKSLCYGRVEEEELA